MEGILNISLVLPLTCGQSDAISGDAGGGCSGTLILSFGFHEWTDVTDQALALLQGSEGMQGLIQSECQAYFMCVRENLQTKVASAVMADMIAGALKKEHEAPTITSMSDSANDALKDLCIDCLKEHPLAALSNWVPNDWRLKGINKLWPVSSEPIINGANPW